MLDNAAPYFEISAINADKPPLSINEINRRVDQFRKAGFIFFLFDYIYVWFVRDFSSFLLPLYSGKNVIISNQPYFYKKAELFPGSAFVIGVDTAIRLVNVRLS